LSGFGGGHCPRLRALLLGAVAIALGTGLVPSTASALSPGSLDPSFGSGGSLLAQLGGGTEPASRASAVAVQADGKVVLAGYASDAATRRRAFLVVRLNADGSFDSSFGSGGKVEIQLGEGTKPFSGVQAMALQPDGKIVLAGFASGATTSEEMMVARLNPDGSFDGSFGSAGKLLVQLGAGGAEAGSEVRAVALQANGRIVLGGDETDAGHHIHVMVARLNPDGSFDGTFGTAGQIAQPALVGSAHALAVQGDGRIVLAGFAAVGEQGQLLVARLNPNGTFDGTFASGGAFTTQLGTGTFPETEAYGLALQPDGRILVDGYATVASATFQTQVLIARLNPDGTPDSSFGSGGSVLAQMGAGAHPSSSLNALTLQQNGRILVGGEATNAGGGYEALVARLDPGGSLDASFGAGGKASSQFGTGTEAFSAVYGLALQPDGKLLFAGHASDAGGREGLIAGRMIADLAPVAMFADGPNPAQPLQAIAFDGTASSDADGTIAAYEWSFGDGTGAAGAAPSHSYATPGTYIVTLTVTDDDGIASSTTGTITIREAPAVIREAPVALSGVSQSHRRWREGNGLPQIARTTTRVPVGTTFRFTVNERASVRFAFSRALPGRRAGHRCVAPSKHNRHHRRCSRMVAVGAFAVNANAGMHVVRFLGRLATGTKLRPGAYTLDITATNAAGERATARMTFTIVGR
jgi:uncharacterized delta-60 repeat protein